MNKHRLPGKLIVIEGIDGAGKSTLASRIVSLLEEDGCTVIRTREPGGTPTGVALRTLIADGVCKSVPEAEFFLFAADRAMHMAHVIVPALQRGDMVICDRMSDSSLVYQGYGHGVNMDMIKMVNTALMKHIHIDLTVYIEIDYQLAQQRISGRKIADTVVYDREKSEFFKQVIRGYETLYANREDVLKVDARLTVETNAQEVYQRICALVDIHDTIQ